MPTLTIAGVVIDSQTRQPLPKLRVEAWDKDVKLSDVLGSYITDEKGRFFISYDELRFRENPKDKWADIYFKVYNGNLLLADGRNTQLFRNLSESRLDITIAVNAQYDAINTFVVQGMILTNSKIDFSKLTVTVLDKDLRHEQKLASISPDTGGHYLAEYTMENARRAEKGTADLFIRVTDAAGKVIGESSITFNASYHAVIDVNINDELVRGLSTLESITRLITPLLDNLDPSELTETDKNRDISFLSAELDLEQTVLENFAAAHQLNKRVPVDVAFYFALLNLNTPSKALLLTKIDIKKTTAYNTYVYLQTNSVLTTLQNVSLEEMETIIKTAVDKNIITAADDKVIKRWLVQWNEYRKKRSEDPAVQSTVVENILDIAGLPKEQRKVFLDKYNAAASIGMEFWKGLGIGKKISTADTERIKSIYDLSEMVGHDMLTTAHVAGKYKISDQAGLRKLSTLDHKEWEGIVRKASSKKGAAISTEAKRLTKRFEKEFPTASFLANAGRSKKTLVELPSLKKFHAAFPDTELHKISVAQFINKNKAALKVSKKDNEGFVNDLMKVQRVFKVAPQYKTTEVLLDNGIHSSAAIYQMGEDNFTALVTSKAGVEKAEAVQMYKRAESTHALSIAIAGDFHSMTTGGAMNALPSVEMQLAQTSLLKELPDLQTLFGSADMCDCQQCRSVYSAAAYMVDLLEYLDKRRSTTAGQSVKTVLFKRRPDIGGIELTCANTNTAMPFIDLVCEILENAVADNAWPLPDAISTELTTSPVSAALKTAILNNKLPVAVTATVQPGKDANEWIVRDNSNTYAITKSGGHFTIRISAQTHLKELELSSKPEFINTAAYLKLQAKFYPFALPFDLAWHSSNGYLSVLNTSRYNLMQTFRKGAIPADIDMAYEYIGMPKVVGDVIANITAGTKADFWGDTTDITRVNTFLAKTNLTYNQMIQLFECRFINPAGADMISIPAGASKCDASIQTITGLTDPVLMKMHRFIRLLQVLGWQFWELDMVVMSGSIGMGSINANFILRLQKLLWLQRTLQLPLESLVVMADGFSTTPIADSLVMNRLAPYHKLFLNKALFEPLDEKFYPENINQGTAAELPGITEMLASHADVIMGALKLTSEEFQFLADATVNKKLCINNLDFIFRYSLLARSLRVSIPDLFTWIELNDNSAPPLSINHLQNPFNSIDKLQSFCETTQKLRRLPFKIGNYNYLFAHRNSTDEKKLIENQIIAYIEAIRKAFIGIDKELAVDGTDVAKEWVKLKLASLASFDDIAIDAFMNMVEQNGVPALTNSQINQLTGWLADIVPLIGAVGLFGKLDEVVPVDGESRLVGKYEFLKAALTTYFKATGYREQMVIITAASYKISEQAAALLLEKLDVTTGVKLMQLFINDANIKTALPITAVNFANLFKAASLLNKAALIINTLSLNTQQVDFILQNAAATALPGFDQIPLAAATALPFLPKLVNLEAFFRLSTKYSGNEALNLVTCLNETFSVTGTLNNWNGLVAQLTTWNVTELANTGTYFSYAFPADYRNIAKLDMLDAAMEQLMLLKTDAVQTAALIRPQLSAADALFAENIVKAQLDETTWFSKSAEVQSPIRLLKRNALTQYLVTNPLPGETWNNSNDLYAYYLIDTEMGAAEITTRILQAELGIQLFVQRCLMNLEAEVIADAETDLKWLQWKWMKNFQVWAANRKVFLYPENYLEPELRPDKSSFFKDLENDLMQNEINTENVETGYISYLEKLDGVARLNVCGTYYDEHTLIFHVFAHTYDEPRMYFYRKWIKDRYWTPWEKVTADIQSEQLIPVVRNSRLYIYWPEFNEVNEEPSNADLHVPEDGGGSSSGAKKYIEIRLAVCEFKNKKWSPKKLSKSKIDTRKLEGGPNAYTRENFIFVPIIDSLQSVLDFIYIFIGDDPKTAGWLEDFLDYYGIENQNLLVCLYERTDHADEGSTDPWQLDHIESFDLGSCHGTPEVADDFVSSVSSRPLVPYFDRSGYYDGEDRETYGSTDELMFHQWGLMPFVNHAPIINKTPGRFRTQFSMQLSVIDKFFYTYASMVVRASWIGKKGRYGSDKGSLPYTTSTLLPFFYEDRSRTFMIQPEMLITYLDPDDPNKVKADELFYSDMLNFINEFATNKKLPDELKKYTEGGVKYKFQPAMHFRNFYHSLVCFFMKQVYINGIDGLLNRDVQLIGDNTIGDAALKDKIKEKFKEIKSLDFEKVYDPAPIVNPYKYPQEDVDFSADGSYAQYNWELFFHGPMYVAGKLSSNQKFEDAMNWYHYIFNPTDASLYNTPQKYWITKPFFLRASTGPNDEYLKQRIDRILGMIHNNDLELLKQVDTWKENPFQPHLIAQFRTVAYQKSVVMKYIDNLIAWGDSLFRTNTRESLGQATNLYILAAEILGNKPKIIPSRNSKTPKSYNQLKPGLDGFSNAVIQLENVIPSVPDVLSGSPAPPAPPLPAIETFYFCLPINEKLLGYWDTIGLRLFNLRNNLTIDGDPRFNALFDPPIDPALLVNAAAAGVDLQDALSDMNAPLPYYRFNIILQKSKEFNNEVKALGAAILSALEKKDGEAMAILRSTNEMKVLQATLALKKYAIQESKESLAGLNQNKKNAELKIKYYGGQLYMNPLETAAFGISTASTVIHTIGSVTDVLAGVLALIPQFNGGASGFGGSPYVTVSYGSEQIAKAAELGAKVMYQTSAIMDKVSGLVSTQAGYVRRKDEWDFQRKQAENDLVQIGRQMAAAEIKIAMAEKELSNHELQIDNSKQTDEFMRSKFTNIDLYNWMINQLSAVYFQSYKMALDMARKAEKCFRYELAQENTGFIQAGYWDSLYKGLNAAEKLSFDLNRMDGSYLAQNKREHEMAKTISLSMLDPLALIELKETGKCEIFIPESLFDMDCPGHYLRRIRSLTVSIPCIIGPYSSVNCKLTLMSSMVRKNTTVSGGYFRDVVNEDSRFIYNYSLVQSIVTSNAQNDSGLFETNLKDERYLPFEGQGAVGRWKIELLQLEDAAGIHIRNFDFNTVSDVLMQMRYTARHGGEAFRKTVNDAITVAMNNIIEYAAASKNRFYRVIPLKHELATEWHRMFNPPLPTGDQELILSLNNEWFPFFLKEKNLQVNDVDIYVKYKKGVDATPFKFAFDLATVVNPLELGAATDELRLKKYTRGGLNSALPINGGLDYKLVGWKQAGAVHSRFKATEIDDIVLVVHYEVA
jgi:hypothetical protein